MKFHKSDALALGLFFTSICIFGYQYINHINPKQLDATVVESSVKKTAKQMSIPFMVTVPSTSNVAEPSVIEETKDAVGQKTVHQLTLDDSNTVLLVGEVGESSFAIAQQITAHSNSSKPIYLLISSPGGSVLDGVEIVSAIQASKAPVYTVCLELCASMAAVIFSFGKERYMVDRSILMFHNAAGTVQGSFNQIKSRFSVFERIVNKLDYEIAKRVGVPYNKFKDQLANELWLDSEDAVEQHYADGLVNLHLKTNSSGASSNVQSQTAALKYKVFVQGK